MFLREIKAGGNAEDQTVSCHVKGKEIIISSGLGRLSVFFYSTVFGNE